MEKPNRNELPTDRLATTDESGNRVYLYPADTRGKYRDRRSWMSVVLLVVFLILPWIRINGHPAVLLNIPARRFALFGVGFWAHEAPMLVFVFGGTVVLLALVTAVWGRVWCGWACPQTVFVDAVFRRVERWVEGDSVQRRRLDESPWSASKFSKKALKWIGFALVSLVISHSFLAYFTGVETLGVMMRSSPSQNPSAFLVMLVMFGLVLFDFGWFREQFCTIVCPYGRFQSVLMDDNSQVVGYDARRGEPRRGTQPASGQPAGDCVNCYRCVQVCPTGVDIRRGVQLECIACTACIDACDEVMSKLHKPAGLIRYASEESLARVDVAATAWRPRFSTRAWIYLVLLTGLGSGLTYTLATRTAIGVAIIRAPEAPYQEMGEGKVVNHFKLDLRNQSFNDLQLIPSFHLRSRVVTCS